MDSLTSHGWHIIQNNVAIHCENDSTYGPTRGEGDAYSQYW